MAEYDKSGICGAPGEWGGTCLQPPCAFPKEPISSVLDCLMRGSDPLRLNGQFIELVPLTPQHAEVTFGWRQGERARLLNRGADTVERQRDWIAGRPDTERNYLIALKNGHPVGMVSLVDIDHLARKAEPARFLIGDEAAARGIPVAAEALLLLYHFAFDTLNLRRLYGIVVSANKPMMKFHEYSGMRKEGVLRDHLFVDEKLHDGIVYGLLEPEFRTVTIRRLNGLIALGNTVRRA